MSRRTPTLALLMAFLFLGCEKKQVTTTSLLVSQYNSPNQYFKTKMDVEIEVHYEEGAEPNAGDRSNGQPLWTVVETNLIEVFSFRSSSPQINVPMKLEDMHKHPDQGKETWTLQEIGDFIYQKQVQKTTPEKGIFYVLFLNGHYQLNGEVQTSTLGLNITGTPYIAIFKPVVLKTDPNPGVQAFVEQSTIIHEMGHALGFVNNGVPLATQHEDEENRGHTSNSDCVMHWKNEGRKEIIDLIKRYITSKNASMWGAEVLGDAQAYSE